MLRIAYEDLRSASCVMQVRQVLSEDHRTKTFSLVYFLKNEGSDRVRFFFSLIFGSCFLNANMNRGNDRRFAHDPNCVSIVGRGEFFVKIHVLSVESNKEDIILPRLLPKRQGRC